MKQIKIIKQNEIDSSIKELIFEAFKKTPFNNIPKFYDTTFKNGDYMFSLYFKEKLAGFIQYSLNKDTLEIETIAVNPKFQKKGFGTMLVSLAISDAIKNKLKKIIVTTLKNYAVEKFYLQNGFDNYSIGYSIQFEDKYFEKISSLSENISKKNNIAFVYKAELKVLEKQKVPFKILNIYQTFKREII